MATDFYESDQALSEYLLLHYGDPQIVLPYSFGPREALQFPVRCARELANVLEIAGGRALDLGCAVGGSSFELARYFEEVIGIDYSEHFIEVAGQLQEHGRYDFSYCIEGEITAKAVALVPHGIDRRLVTFQRGDAQNLPSNLGKFDLVLMANLIDRLGNPRQCLQQLPNLVNPCGQLMLTSPYTWTTEYTPRENWLGGFMRDGYPVDTLTTLKEQLSADFTLSTCKDLPFLIREHARKFQWSVAQATVWTRKAI